MKKYIFSEAVDALAEYLRENGISASALIELRILDPEIEKEMTAVYSEEYDRAPDGDPHSDEDLAKALFTSMAGDKFVPTKGDILREWAEELRKAFPKAYMKDYTREETITMLNLLNSNHIDLLRVRIIPGCSYSLFDLARGWDETHPDEKEIVFSGYDIMP